MMKGLLADLLNGFSLYDIPVLLIQIFIAATMAWLIKVSYQKKFADEQSLSGYFILIAILVVLVSCIAKNSIQSAFLGTGILFIAGNIFRNIPLQQSVYFFGVVTFSMACGLGYVPVALLTFIIFYLFLLLNNKK